MEATVGPQLRWEAMARVLGRCGIDVGFSRQVVVVLNEVVSDLHRSVLGLGHTPIKEAPGPYRWMLNVNLRACRGARGNRQERRRWAREVITLDLLIPHQTVFFRQAREKLSVAAGELSRHVCI